MSRFTTSLSFPDVNVWLALMMEDHVHRRSALEWWRAAATTIVFMRLTGMSVPRLPTTASAMNGRPLGMDEAWSAYDRLFDDDCARSAGGRLATFDRGLAGRAAEAVLLE